MHLDSLPIRICWFGVQGSGKTASMKVAKLGMAGSGVVMYEIDPADESVALYRDKMRPEFPVYPISMKYTDGYGIDFAALITTEADRIRLAQKLIPDGGKEQEKFWIEVPRQLLKNAARTLHQLAPGKAMLADMIRVVQNPDMHALLSELAGLGDPYLKFGDNRSRNDIVVTLDSKLEQLALFAACDLKCTERLKLPIKFGAVVFEWSDTFAPALAGIYSLMMDAIGEMYLSEQRQGKEHVALVVDEFRQLEPLKVIEDSARRGRKSQISILASVHEITGLYDRYGKDRAEEMMGLFEHKIFLKLGSPTTAKWASEYLGSVEVLESIGPRSTDGSAKSIQQRITMRPNVLPDELRHGLKKASYEKNTMEGYLDFPGGPGKFSCGFKDEITLQKRSERRELRKSDDQLMPALTLDDFVRLGITTTAQLRRMLS
jgi:type IV secretory pathway TraG/TraD family ATPase VirD4